MDTTSQILSGLFGIAMVLLIAPRILAVNQGKVLRNITIWVGIFLLLALAYKNFGPTPLDQAGSSVTATSSQSPEDSADKDKDTTPPEVQINEDNGFSPPQGD